MPRETSDNFSCPGRDVIPATASQEFAEAQGVFVGEVHRSWAFGHQAARSPPAISSKRIALSTCSGERS